MDVRPGCHDIKMCHRGLLYDMSYVVTSSTTEAVTYETVHMHSYFDSIPT